MGLRPVISDIQLTVLLTLGGTRPDPGLPRTHILANEFCLGDKTHQGQPQPLLVWIVYMTLLVRVSRGLKDP